MRQLTYGQSKVISGNVSKLPMRQLTISFIIRPYFQLSKLPMRQLTRSNGIADEKNFSKLPMRQLTGRKREQ